MGWLRIFIIYLALPVLFFKLLSTTPVEELASWGFVLTNLTATFCAFTVVFILALVLRRASLPDATIQGLAGAYGNIGYMGSGLAILIFGDKAAVPLALIFCFENAMHFTIAPTIMALSGKKKGVAQLVLEVARGIAFHPFIIATVLGVGAAIVGVAPPGPVTRLIDYLAQAAAPSALFAMGVTLALSPLKRAPCGAFLHRPRQTRGPSDPDVRLIERCRGFPACMGIHRRAGRGVAHRHQRVRHRPALRPLGGSRLGLHTGNDGHLHGEYLRPALRHHHRTHSRRPVQGLVPAIRRSEADIP